MSDVIVTSLSTLQNEVRYGDDDTLITDEPVEAGGEDANSLLYKKVRAFNHR